MRYLVSLTILFVILSSVSCQNKKTECYTFRGAKMPEYQIDTFLWIEVFCTIGAKYQ